ncbi:MAG: nicotinate-nucleotide adenylyltransferase [Termitinemataceae bacterium]|nr:MAG: nicotinate-nucleotide adenylyltransferase [Termitinemataceae bacterium]
MKYAIIGGSFDPFHNGHLALGLETLKGGFADRCIFVPAFRSPFKTLPHRADAAMRSSMVLASISGDTRWTIDTCELDRGGISYTIDTLRDIRERYGRCCFVIGDDLCDEFHTWKEADKIASIADIVVASRDGRSALLPYPHSLMHNSIVQISSSEVREKIESADDTWEELVPPPVAEIIKRKKLYTDKLLQPKIIEDEVRSILQRKRFIHSRNVALHCADLAARFNMDSTEAYIAGITHDVCKELNDEDTKAMALLDGLPLSLDEKQKPSLLHGRASAMFIQQHFGIDEQKHPHIIEAVRYHTSGIDGMCDLAKIVYLCDKIEVGRKTVDQKLRSLAFCDDNNLSLDEIFKIVLKATCEYLEERGIKVLGSGAHLD